jgi:hypothetical protein
VLDALATATDSVISRIDQTDSSLSVLSGRVQEFEVSLTEVLDSDFVLDVTGQALSDLSTRIDRDSDRLRVVSQDVTELSVAVDSDFASISSTLQTIVDDDGNASAVYALNLDVNNHIAGIRLDNDGNTANFAVTADTFKIINASDNEIQPFTVDGDQVELSNATVTGNLDVTTSDATGSMNIKGNLITISDANGTVRVKLGDLSA